MKGASSRREASRPCFYVVPEAMHEASRGPLKGGVSAQKTPPGKSMSFHKKGNRKKTELVTRPGHHQIRRTQPRGVRLPLPEVLRQDGGAADGGVSWWCRSPDQGRPCHQPAAYDRGRSSASAFKVPQGGEPIHGPAGIRHF